ncbi:AsnC family transcriptional regulator [Mycolicibacterium nivoides]|uniref:AsnC family transcriptional regulator n=1 Tax=Mycolicibacterium nivoides TaxID=2487344 RepID=A0ABW9LMT9_9MYCO
MSCTQRYAPTAVDRPILEALAEDGCTPQSILAARTGWSVAQVSRRIAALEACGDSCKFH